MNRVKYELFDGEAEVTSFYSGTKPVVEFSFTEPYDGFLSIDEIVVRVTDGVAVFDLRLMSDGEFTPVLILKQGTVKLPKIKKTAKKFCLSDCESDYVRKISLRERRLAERVKLLEGELEGLRSCIYGTKIL